MPGPGRHLLGAGGILHGPSFADDFAAESGKPFLAYGGALLVRDLLGAIQIEPEVLLRTSGAKLHVLVCAHNGDRDARVPWLESACWSDPSTLVGAFDPGPGWLCQGLEAGAVVQR